MSKPSKLTPAELELYGGALRWANWAMQNGPAVDTSGGDQRVAEGPPGDDGKCPWCGGPILTGHGLMGDGFGEYWLCIESDPLLGQVCDYLFKIQDPDIPIESMPPHGVCFDDQGRAGRWVPPVPDDPTTRAGLEYVEGLRGAVAEVQSMFGVDAHTVDRIVRHVGGVADMLEASILEPDDEEDDHVGQDPQAG